MNSHRNPTRQHIKALLRKNWILFKRSCCCSCCEMLLPVLFGLMLLIIRSRISKSDIPETSYIDSSQPLTLPNSKNPFFSVALAPKCDFTEQLAAKLTDFHFKSQFFSTNEEINEYIRHPDYGEVPDRPNLLFGIHLEQMTPNSYQYSLRFNVSGNNPVINTNKFGAIAKYYPANVDEANKYINSGFLYMQNLIDSYIFAIETNATVSSSFKVNSVEVPAYVEDKLADRLQDTAQVYVVFPWIVLFLRFLYRLLYEKERKITEGMKMMGMNNTAFYSSWLLTYGIISFLSVFVTTIIFKFFFVNSNFILLFLWEWLFVLCLLAQALFVSVFFTRPRSGIMAGLLFFFVQYYVNRMVDSSSDATLALKTATSLAPHAAMSFASATFIQFETLGYGIDFSTISEEMGNYKVSICFGMVIMNIFLYSFLAIYLDQVIPNEFGKKKHPLFLIKCLFTSKPKNNRESAQITPKVRKNVELFNAGDNDNSTLQMVKNAEETYSAKEKDLNKSNIEPVDANLRQQELQNQTLNIKNLCKIYPNGKKAVNDLSLTMYKGQIFSLLGHNGAGKTTTISILTGLIEASSGLASVFGLDILNNMDEIRHFLGVCPQHDILFDDLTVKEHLVLFATFKGVPKNEIEAAVLQMIQNVGLEEKTNFRAKNLSGGQKRKLSVGIAYIGDSKLILLDEPTSGMDTSARRFVWEMVKNNKNDKIVILTTHFMDEADFLGDRIGIMSSGELKCCGSSIFLKNSFGIGYNLIIVKKNAQPSPEIKKLVLDIISKGNLLSDVSAEISFQLPLDMVHKFPELFNLLDEKKEKLGILSYGVSITTLEEVFLKVAEGDFSHRNMKANNDDITYQNIDDFDMKSIKIESFLSLFWLRLQALILKRLRYFKRDMKGIIAEIFLPIIVVIIGLCLMLITFNRDPDSRVLTLSLYSGSSLFLFAGKNPQILRPYLNPLIEPFYLDTMDINLWNTQLYIFRDPPSNVSNTIGGYYFKTFDLEKNVFEAVIEGDTRYTDSYPILLNNINQALIRAKTNEKNFEIIVKNEPFPQTMKEAEAKKNISAIFAVFVFSIGMALIPASLIVFIVKERQYNIKHQQLVSGAGLFTYWTSNLIVDWVKALIPTVFCVIMCKAFDISAFLEDDCFSAIWLLFIFFGFSIISFTYAFSFAFKDYGSAQTVSFIMNFLVGGILPLIFFILRVLDEQTKDISLGIAMILRLLPSFSFGFGILNVAERSLYMVVADEKTKRDALDTEIAGYDVAYLIVLSVFYFVLVFIIEKILIMPSCTKFFTRESNYPYQEKPHDSDVKKERELVAKSRDYENYAIYVNQIRKVFSSSKSNFRVAVDSVSFAIPNGECFGLLGINGAGKTTTFKMLCGEIPPTSGDIYIAGYNIFTNLDKIRENIGYCPQFDALLDLLTSKEHLELFAALKGIPKSLSPKLIEKKLNEMNLKPFENVCAGTYSGGNKRKLSVALAMLGNPPIVFLDEPSTGMDPEARRFMWNVISRISTERKKSSIILTTHSMEEAEALSTRLAIMVNGAFQCLGSVQHIKNKFGKGYELEIKLIIPCEDDFEQMYRVCGKKRDCRIYKNDYREVLNALGKSYLEKEIKQGGFGSHIYHDIDNPNGVAIEVLFAFVISESDGEKLLDSLKKNFGETSIIEHFQTFYRFKLQAEVSIGKLFSFFETNKALLRISQYSIKQATIEQIFNMFAAGQIPVNEEESNLIQLRKHSSLLHNDGFSHPEIDPRNENQLIMEDMERSEKNNK